MKVFKRKNILKKFIPLVFFIFIFTSLQAFGDTLHMSDGRIIKGKIVSEDEYYVRVKTKYGIMRIEKEEIDKIVRIQSPQEIHESRLKKCFSARDYYQLGLWAKSKKLQALALKDFETSIRLDPGFGDAHKALGHIYYRGRWWSESDYKTKVKGLVYKNGEWVSKKEAAQKEAQLNKKRAKIIDKLWKKRRTENKGVPWPVALQHPIETKHYKIYCNSSPEVARRYADFLEQLFNKFDKIFAYYRPIYSKEIRKRKSIIMIHRNMEEFLNMHAMDLGTGGFFLPKSSGALPARSVVAFHGSFGETGNTFGVLAHEGTHQFENLVMPSIMNRPIWLIEGLAVFFGDGHKLTSRGKLKVGIIPRDRLATLQEAIRKGTYIRLKELFRTPQSRFGGFHYSHGWGVIYYMLDPQKKLKKRKTRKRRKKMQQIFQKFFDLNCRKEFSKNPAQNTMTMATVFEGMIKKELGQTVEEFEKDWKKFILSLKVDPIGKIRGNRFISKLLKFKVAKPFKYSWKLKMKDLKPGEKIVIENQKSTGKFSISASGNGSLYTSQELGRWMKLGLGRQYSNLKIFSAKKVYHKGYRGFEIFYRGLPLKTQKSSEVRKTEQTVRLLILATMDTYYMIRCQADSDRFGENKKTFQWIMERFELIP